MKKRLVYGGAGAWRAPRPCDSQAVPRKGSKYHNVRVVLDGITFDSKREARRYTELRLLERAGHIGELKVHPSFSIVVRGVEVCKYEADFTYYVLGGFGQADAWPNIAVNKCGDRWFVVEDVKGMRTDVYRLKKKLLKATLGWDIYEPGRRR